MTSNKKTTSLEVFLADKEKIKLLATKLNAEMGGFVSQRQAVMLAVNKLLKDTK